MSLLVYPEALRSDPNMPASMMFEFFEFENARKTDARAEEKIVIYMPEEAAQPSTVRWDTESFGFIGDQIGARGASFREGFARGGMMEGMSAATEGFGASSAAGGDLAMARGMASAGSMLAQLSGGSVTAEGLMGTVAGKIPNPYLTMVFKGIDFRSFAFVFKFYPFSAKDCDAIYEIYQTFRKNSLPSYGPDSQSKTFLGYPKVCQISYLWENQTNPWLHKFKRCACTGIDLNYTATGMFSVMRNGFPSEIIMSTKWTEIDLVTAEDIETKPNWQGSY